MKWKVTHITVNTKQDDVEYDCGDGVPIVVLNHTINAALKHHPSATSMVLILVRENGGEHDQ